MNYFKFSLLAIITLTEFNIYSQFIPQNRFEFLNNVGFNTTLNFRIGEIIRNRENPLFVAGVDFIIGWLVKI